MSGFDRNGDQSQICKICGKTCKSLGNHLIEHKISAKNYYDRYIRKPNEGRCKMCGKDTKFKTLSIGYIGKYCSPECTYSDKDHPNPNAWKDTRNAKIQQFEKEHNCIFANDLRNKYGNGWYQQKNLVHFIYMDSQTKFVPINELQLIIDYSSTHHNPTSKKENDLVDFIKQFYNKEIKTSITNILQNKSYELDIYLPDINLAIEYNGIRYHSIEMDKPKDRILNKSIQCRNLGIRLIHIYEFEDFEEQKQLLKNLILGVDNYPKNDFNKNNLINNIPNPEIIFKNNYFTVYGAGKLY